MLHFEYDLIFYSQNERSVDCLFIFSSPSEYHFRFTYKVECGLSQRNIKSSGEGIRLNLRAVRTHFSYLSWSPHSQNTV